MIYPRTYQYHGFRRGICGYQLVLEHLTRIGMVGQYTVRVHSTGHFSDRRKDSSRDFWMGVFTNARLRESPAQY